MITKSEKRTLEILTACVIFVIFCFIMLGFLLGRAYEQDKDRKEETETAKIESDWPAVDPVKYYGDQAWTLTFDPILYGYLSEPPLEYVPEPVEAVSTPFEEGDVKMILPEDDLALLAACMEAECGAEDLQTICYCVDVVLNRVDHQDWPDNIHDVIYQKHQFSVVANGSMKQKWNQVCDNVYLAISMETENRQNNLITFFDDIGGIHGDQKTKFKSGGMWFMEGRY